MLFVLAYSLLKAVINPENFAKGEQSFPKLVQNVVVSLIIIAVLPTVFSVAFNIQSAVLNQDTIPKLILGEDYNAAIGGEGRNPGRNMAFQVYGAFVHENFDYCLEETSKSAAEYQVFGPNGGISSDRTDCMASITTNDNSKQYDTVFNDVENGQDFISFSWFSKSVVQGKIDYYMIISTIAGIFVAYVLLNFCFDMALRVIKLMFFQIIAPIPVVCRIMPGGKMKDVFPDWVKKTISTFVEVFIRILVLYLGLFIINEVIANFKFDIGTNGLGFTQLLIAKALLIMGVVIFIKQAPKLIGDMFHLDSGSMKLGIMDKLAMGGALTAAGAAGAMVTQGGRNAITSFKESRKRGLGVAGTAWNTLRSGVAGGASAGVRAAWAGKGAKNLKDMKAAANKGIADADARKSKRDSYIAEHRSGLNGPLGSAQTLGNVLSGHVIDYAKDVGQYWGFSGNADSLIADNKVIDDIASKKKAVSSQIDSLIDKEAAKSSSSFAYGGFSATELRRLYLNIADAKTGLLKDASGRQISVTEAQQAYDQYRYDFSQRMQNVVLSEAEYKRIEATDKGLAAKLADPFASGVELKDTLAQNLDKPYLQAVGFTAENVHGDLDVINHGPLKDLGDELDIQKSKNNQELTKIRREQEKSGDKK